MDNNIYKTYLKDIIHNKLYTPNNTYDMDGKKLEEIRSFVDSSSDKLEAFSYLVSDVSNDYMFYIEYLRYLLVSLEDKEKIDILNNKDKYKDVIRDTSLYIDIYKSLDSKELFLKRDNYDEIDSLIINSDDKLIKKVINNKDYLSKVLDHSLDIDIKKVKEDKLLISKIKRNNFSRYINNNIKSIKKIESLLNSYYDEIEDNSLLFNNNKSIYTLLKKNNKFINKFDKKYLNLFNIDELNKIYKAKDISGKTFSNILEVLYNYDKSLANEYFSKDNLKKCLKNSITVNPFLDLSEDNRNMIMNDYSLFNKFSDGIKTETMLNLFNESEILNILRNDEYIIDASSYSIELLLNRLPFKSSFNMLQNSNILKKVEHLNIGVNIYDEFFIKSFLDSPIMVYKSNHNMIYECLNLFNYDDTLTYLYLPYIINNLSNEEIVKLIRSKNININDLLELDIISKKLKKEDIINYIESADIFDLSIFYNKRIVKLLFNIDDELLDKINFQEVNYLFETIRMKSLLSKNESKINVVTYKCTILFYLVFGLDNAIKIISNGNKDVSLDQVISLKKRVINELVLSFKENNNTIFQNMSKKIIKNLDKIKYYDDINEFSKEVRRNTYLDNIIYLLLDNNYDSYNNIINMFYSYVNYNGNERFAVNKNIYDYTMNFINYYIGRIRDGYSLKFDNIVRANFKLKENIIYKRRNELGKEFLRNKKLSILLDSLVNGNNEYYKNFYNIDITSIKDKYIKFLHIKKKSFDDLIEHVIRPLVNKRFDIENALNKMNIKKPNNYDIYAKYVNNVKVINDVNELLDELDERYNINDIINYLIYDIKLSYKIKKKDLECINKYKDLINDINFEIYPDNNKITYKYNLDIYNINEIIEYEKYKDIINNLISKSYKFTEKYMNEKNVLNTFMPDYLEYVNVSNDIFPISTKYYELNRRPISLQDIVKVFNGCEINDLKVTNNLVKFLEHDENLVLVAEGYYDLILDNFGVIISNYKKIDKLRKEFGISKLNVISANRIMEFITLNDNLLVRNTDDDILKDIYDDNNYEVNLKGRLNSLGELYRESLKKIYSFVPYVDIVDENYEIKVIDSYSSDIFRSVIDSKYKIGLKGESFLRYVISNPKGIMIGVYEDNKLISKILGVRNGNTLFLNKVEGKKVKEDLIRLFGNKVLDETKDSNEPINFVTIVNNELYGADNEDFIDEVMCPIINNPVDEEIDTDYEGNSSIMSSNMVIDKDNFKYYEPTVMYYRKRNNVIKLSNNINDDYLSKIDNILYLCKLDDKSVNIDDIKLSNMDTIFMGDDFVLFKNEKGHIFKYNLNYDKRSINEINILLDSLS